MPAGRFWVPVLIATLSAMGAAFGATSGKSASSQAGLVERERRAWSPAVHNSKFAPVANSVTRAVCEDVQPPQALTTPDPLLDQANRDAMASITFIVGTDGRVHSALMLESAGPHEDRAILAAVQYWRYRPALCDGVPTDAEGKVEFSSRQERSTSAPFDKKPSVTQQ